MNGRAPAAFSGSREANGAALALRADILYARGEGSLAMKATAALALLVPTLMGVIALGCSSSDPDATPGPGVDEAGSSGSVGSSGGDPDSGTGSSGSSGSSGGADGGSGPLFTLGGTATGLAGIGLTLKNGASLLVIPANGPFVFPAKVKAGTPYDVTVATQPSSVTQTCTVTSGSGIVGPANVTSVAVACKTESFTVGGTVAGLTGTAVLTLVDTTTGALQDVTVTGGSAFVFPTALPSGRGYYATIKTQPSVSEVCTVTPNSGTVTTGPLTNLALTCGLPTSCRDLKVLNFVSPPVSGDYAIDPDGAGAHTPITAYCDLTTDGGGYLMYGVTGGISTTAYTQPNSCDALGLHIAIPRTKAHLDAMVAKYGLGYMATVPGVYGKLAGNYTACVMNYLSLTATCRASWGAIDNGLWFIRSVAMTEPSGNYTPGCWLATNGYDANGLIFDDNLCIPATGTSYICSDNRK
jgi:hypothetical protein